MKGKYYLVSLLLLFNMPILIQAQRVEYRINLAKHYQTIDGFGASDAWSMSSLGLWPKAKTAQIADWLFSTKNDKQGKPKGIGLSIWRFNLGAGSAEQGDSSYINPGTRTECFLKSDGTYDWTKQAGQRCFLRLAKERGVNYFLAFLNSPPVYFTKNGLATNTGRGGTLNLKENCYDKFADFLVNVVKGLEKHEGIHLSYVSPFNEPDGDWNWLGPNQEGSPATNREMAKFIRLLGDKFRNNAINTQIMLAEASDLRALYKSFHTDWQRGHSIQSFFCKDSVDTYVGNVPNVPRLIEGHSYWTNTPLDSLYAIRSTLRSVLQKHGVKFWMSELCIMKNDVEIGGDRGCDRTMNTALYVGRVIHHDLVIAGAGSWQWWRAVVGDYRNGLVVGTGNGKTTDGTAVDSKLLWVMGNYSRFIRPGAIRLDVSAFDANNHLMAKGDTDPHGLMCSAYRNKDGKLVFVVLNYAHSDKQITFNAKSGKRWVPYITSDKQDDNLRPMPAIREGSTVTIPQRSAVTFVS